MIGKIVSKKLCRPVSMIVLPMCQNHLVTYFSLSHTTFLQLNAQISRSTVRIMNKAFDGMLIAAINRNLGVFQNLNSYQYFATPWWLHLSLACQRLAF